MRARSTTAVLLTLSLWAAPQARGQGPTAPAPVVLLVRPSTSAPSEAFEPLRIALEAAVGDDARIGVVTADQLAGEANAQTWGAAVARSEGADAVIWLREDPDGGEVMWLVRVGERAEAFSVRMAELSAFDRGRALALAARPLLDPLLAGPSAPTPGAQPDAEETPRENESVGAEAPASRAAVEPGATPSSNDGDDVPLVFHTSLGAFLRSDGPTPSAQLTVDLTFLEYGWVELAGELAREERSDAAANRDRTYLLVSGGVELAWRFLRGRFGAVVGLALVWEDGADAPGAGLTVGASAALGLSLTDALYLELPLAFHATAARPSQAALPDVEVAIGLRLGISVRP